MPRSLRLLALIICLPAGLTSHGIGQTKGSQSAVIKEYMKQGQAALRDNRPMEAEQAFRAVLEIDQANVDARADLGIVAMAQGKWPEAAQELHRALDLRPAHQRVRALLGLCELHLGQTETARELLSSSFPYLDDPKLRREAGLQLFELWYQGRELGKAITVINQLRELYPNDAAVLYAMYRVHSDLAFQAIDSLALAAPDSSQLHRALAEHLVNEGHLQEAVAEYRDALESEPDVAGVHYELGETLLAAESHSETGLADAEKEFKAALVLDPADPRPECKLGGIELLRSELDTAHDHFEHALKLNPDLVCAQVGIAGILVDEGKKEEALGYLNLAARTDPYNAEVRYKLAVLDHALGQNADADREVAAFKELTKVQGLVQKGLTQTLPKN